MAKHIPDVGEPLLWDFATVAYKLGISRQQVYRELAKGTLHAISIGRRARRVPAAEVARFIDAKLRAGAA